VCDRQCAASGRVQPFVRGCFARLCGSQKLEAEVATIQANAPLAKVRWPSIQAEPKTAALVCGVAVRTRP